MSEERGGRIGQSNAQAEPPQTRAASMRKLVVIDENRELCQFLELVLKEADYEVAVTRLTVTPKPADPGLHTGRLPER